MAVRISVDTQDARQHTQGNKIRTPPLVGTILPGITRMSVLQLAQDLGYDATEEPVPISDALESDEVFTTGAPTCAK